MELILAFVSGGLFSLLCASLGGFIAVKLRLGAQESILKPKEPSGDAFNLDDIGSPEAPGRVLRPIQPETPDELPDEADLDIIFRQNSRFLSQLAAEKATAQG